VLRFAIKRSLTRVGRGLPVANLLLAGEVALLAGEHIARLDPPRRRRLLVLLRQAAAAPRSFPAAEREELTELLADLEPRLFVGSAARKLSPVPVPKRILFGPRGSRARSAAKGRSGRRATTDAPSG
jgi:hypothetical protein